MNIILVHIISGTLILVGLVFLLELLAYNRYKKQDIIDSCDELWRPVHRVIDDEMKKLI